ncbi:hypothetical protein [Nonomuraea sp. NPDC049709]|uniref:hypothetical protein n=1 Tax=Nonomuraea sp. NPDC049709 TaxID=3154736 RepID=UPI0034381E83
MRTAERLRAPWPGIMVSLLSLAAMIAISWAVWDSLPELVTTREATPRRAGVRVPRLILAAALPATLVVIGIVMAGATAVADRLRPHLPPLLVASPSRQTRSMNVLFVLLPPFLTVLHGGLLLRTAGHDVPLERGMAVAIGLLLAGLGLALPRISARLPVPGWGRAQRLGGLAMTAVGAGCAAGALFLPPLLVSVAAALAAGVIPSLPALVALARARR